jgi:hypothetical protein
LLFNPALFRSDSILERVGFGMAALLHDVLRLRVLDRWVGTKGAIYYAEIRPSVPSEHKSKKDPRLRAIEHLSNIGAVHEEG